MLIRSLLTAAALLTTTSAIAQAAAPLRLTLERIYGNPALGGPAPRALKLSPDGKWLTSLRNRADEKERYDLWAVDTTSGEARMLLDSTKFGSAAALSEAEKMQRERARIADFKGIVDYGWSPDGRSILVPLDGDMYLAGLDGTVRRLTETATSELDGTVSPKGGFVSFVRDQNLFVHHVATAKESQLTRDGGSTLSWGVAEFVAQEEIDRHRGHWWSPDEQYLAVARVDESAVQVVTRAAIGADGTKVYDQRYPRAGTPNAKVDLYVMRADGSAAFKLDLDDDPDFYLARVDWAPDGKSLYIQWQNRAQTVLHLLKADIATRKIVPLITEEAKTWLNLHDDFRALRDGSLIWSSERSGYKHLYRWQAGKLMPLTRGPWVVKKLIGVDQVNKRLYFQANPDTPIEWQLYALDYEKRGARPVKISEAGFDNDAIADRGATRFVVTRSSQAQPPQSYLADAAGKRLMWIEQNQVAGDHPYAPYLSSHVVPSYGTLKVDDGTVLHYELRTPRLEPGKRYPVILQVYGGPNGGRQVANSWEGGLPQYWVDRGWIVYSIDNRGTPDRGKAFEDHIHRHMGRVEVADQLAGVAWLKAQPFVDPQRIIANGWSYGGYMVLKLLEAAPGTFVAGISGAPVTSWELYDTHYTERYLGNPATDPGPYGASDALADAGKIRDPLLLIHGMSDDNVVLDNSTALMAKLQQQAVPFEAMMYPGQGHRVSGPGISVHLSRTIERFIARHVGEDGR
jgi:dipeptidyl-peptidase-4